MDPVSILQALVAIPSVNPMGRDVSGPLYFEGRMSDWLEKFFRGLGVVCERVPVSEGRDNVLARFDSPGSRTTILLDAHQDTVPVEGMTINPFDPQIHNGRLSGRGACDDKGPMAAMLAAFARLVQDRPAGAANVVMCCTCDEEAHATGALHLAKSWVGETPAYRLVPQRPDICIAAEPTDLDIVVAHRGASRWKVRTKGRSCHSSRPELGINAIYKMADVLKCLEHFAGELGTMVPAHPLCGQATISVGRIEGGISVNTVPDECTIEIDRRCLPGEDGWEVIRQVDEYLRRRLDVDFEFLPPWLVGMSLSDDTNSAWADRFLKHVHAVEPGHQKVGVAYGTNASRFYAYGAPAFVFGPGSIDQAHTVDEWIDLAELQQSSDILYGFCASEG